MNIKERVSAFLKDFYLNIENILYRLRTNKKI